ncbi:putative RSR1-GTP-binding protein [Microstroma glucosiphilum]|uniref:Putative RSR1-GTP-binding protein n=1 Tax=Pseudomicrostroma glucosiphilum TaxID=1684307 RepID=A0A316U424_9BASI|nr:putative RSR1-GTP-binding protein [Pseudomicrostroma glucosiphilum]PWN19920.1 putative RSR1-GTP-binding protein [Pseudomicrostroma glucosiphilum]
MADKDDAADIKIVMLGGGGVGKSALTLQFVKGEFLSTYDPTIEETYRKTMEVDGLKSVIEIMDTAGTEQFTALKEIYMKAGNAFILVFSLTHLGSVNELGELREQILRLKGRKVPLILVGNKSDLKADRQCPQEVGANLSRLWGKIPYYEASARKGTNVDEIFEDAVRQCRAMETSTQLDKKKRKEGLAEIRGKGRMGLDSKKCVVM